MDYISIDNIKEWLKLNLNEERYEHSIGVAETAYELAVQFNQNKEKAYITGLIHDCAKCIKNEALLDIMNTHIDVLECEKINPKTYHAPAGVYIAKKEFNITDDEILSAIRWHTIGHINMTTFDKIIFIADKIEPRTRPVEYINKIKSKLKDENGLDMALLECYKGTIKSLVDRNLKICIETINIYNELLLKYE